MTYRISIALFLLVPGFAATQPDVANQLDRFLQAHENIKGFMGTALVARGGKILIDKGCGFANVELKVANTPDNKFRIGSITKQFTAAAIMQLQEQGKLNVTDLACKYVDNCPDTWKAITIHQLLSHTSGIPSYTGQPAFPTPKFMRIPLTPVEVLMLTRDKPLRFQPGEKWEYDNSGYIFLGCIIEKVSGRNYADYVKEHIFDLLDMSGTGYDKTREVLPGRAAGYEKTPTGYRNADYLDMSLPYAAGSLYSTTHDLYTWDRALYTGKVVGAKSYAAMTTAVKNDYGYGLTVAPLYKHKQVGHGGGINGFSTCINRFPDDDAVVIVLSNLTNGNACAVGSGLAGILFGEKVAIPQNYTEVPIDPKMLDRYVGKYSDGKIEIKVTAENGKLYVEPAGQRKMQVLPYSDHQFFLKMPDVNLEFPANESRAGELTLEGGGPKITAKRID